MLLRRLAAAGCLLALAAGGLTGCSTSGASATGSKGYVEGDGTFTLIPAAQRKPAPDLSGSLVGGGTARVSADRGRVVVLNVWASWCAPCRQEAPDLARAARALPKAAFFGIDTRDDGASAEAFQRTQRIPYPSFEDQDGSLVLRLQSVISMNSLPMTVVLDKEGRVAAAVYGPTTATTIEDIAAPLERES